MKLLITILCLTPFSLSIAQVGIGTTTPDARLDIISSNQSNPQNTDGILIPRIDTFPSTNPTASQNGMLVFLTTTSGSNPSGFYFWDQSSVSWVGFTSGSSTGWEITGNSNTTSGTNYIGTSNNQALDFRVNGIRKLRLETQGNLSTLNMGRSVYIGLGAGMNDDLFENDNVGVGENALSNNTSGQRMVAIGRNALTSNTIGNDNVALGEDTLGMNIDGNRNIGVGQSALEFLNTGNGNIAIGYKSNAISTNMTNAISFGTGSSAVSHQIWAGNSSHTSIGGNVGWSVLSDARFKKNINANVPGLDFILKLNPVTYQVDIDKFNEFKGTTKLYHLPEFSKEIREKNKRFIHSGFLAQEVEETANSIGYEFNGVDKPKDQSLGNYGLRYAMFIVPLVKAMQEQQEMIKVQQNKIELLEIQLEKIMTHMKKKE